VVKRIISVLVAALALSSMVFAEGGKEGGKAGAPVVIEIWMGKAVSEASDPPADWEVLKIAREKYNIDLRFSWLPTSEKDADAKINTAAAANALPDLFQVTRERWLTLVKMGLIAKVDSMLPLMPTRTKQFMSKPIDKTVATFNNGLYGLPTPGAMPQVEGLVIRKDWLAKLGLKAPTTLDEFYAVCKAFTEQDPDGNGRNDTYGFGAYIENTAVSRGLGKRFDFIFGAYEKAGIWDLDAATFGLNVRKPDYIKGLEFVLKMQQAGYIDPDWPNLKKDDFRARWKQGKFGIMWEQFAALAAVGNYAPFDKNFPDGEWMAIQPPKGPQGRNSNGVNVANYRIYAVSAKAEKAGKMPYIAQLLEWMSTDGYYMIGWGKEGVNYNKDENGTPTINAVGDKPAIPRNLAYASAPETQARNLVFYNSPIEMAARYPTYTTANGRLQGPLMYWEEFKKTPYTDAWGAGMIDAPTQAADFYRFYDENMVKFALGTQPLSGWNDFLAGLDKLGAKEWEKVAKERMVALNMLQ